MIDLHCHLDLYPEPSLIAKECASRGLNVLSVTTTPSAWNGTNAIAQRRTKTALGLHPQLANERYGELELFDELLPRVPYIGEIGLDGSKNYRQHWNKQLTVFNHILDSCVKAGGRIMSIHSRRAAPTVLDCIENFADAGIPILHWFSGSTRDLQRAIDMGCWFSVGPPMLFTAKGKDLVTRIPRSRVIPESDGPFAEHNGQPLLPWHTAMVYRELSNLWSVAFETVDELLTENFVTLIGHHEF
ncbi:Qat anti-phage system TatD family nuclease QatD [Ferroacidibacillus organovorans]|uniref:Hydrolase TatD n=1 Tax=Ferroacidibacillus organovorans TaxID=1765683 RepID=A0A853KDZ2_9BACL|nr:hydrolase TatD [Ferroacidibacillus organovorans]OAG94574.1 hydrolase TatD [Ferroacidibacillus organovorans]